MASGTGVAGSVKIGERCMFGGQVGIVPHTIIGNDAQIGAQSGISHNVPEKGVVSGTPAMPALNFNKSFAVFKNLYELQKTVYALQKEVEELKKKE
jgi:UDP-3-O-[3-hydroxymyristoyl] glucosamine N-acyltransferase